MAADAVSEVVFIQNALPPLGDGAYLLEARHEVPGQSPGTFTAAATFVVQGERFKLAAGEIEAVFPPNLANGEYDGVLPHVVLSRCRLPWERNPVTPGSKTVLPDPPWLAVLVLDDEDAPPLLPVTAKDLVPSGTPIYSLESKGAVGTGTLDDETLSYGAAVLGTLGYGEKPDDPCAVIDLPVDTFHQVAPSAADLQYLAHVREVDTVHASDTQADKEQRAVVLANRIPPADGTARAYLVSLEGMSDFLPASDGTPNPRAATFRKVRLIVYQAWSFTTNDMDQTLEGLLTGLNAACPRTPSGDRITTLTLPISGQAPTPAQIAQAMTNQAAGQPSVADATVLMQNALLLGYVPMEHHLRHGGRTVSFYRGPLAPVAVPSAGTAYFSGPDAANAYDPQTGLFDVSYGAAWQLGQLLALQSPGMANQLYAWKRSSTRQQAAAAELAQLAKRLQSQSHFESVLGRRRALLADGPPPLPQDVQDWFSRLAGLEGVPFNYLVPDERMLPAESVRFFCLDPNWMDALIDGAFSIGRANASPQSLEVRHAPALRRRARAGVGLGVRSRRQMLAASGDALGSDPVTGLLLRSQAIAGWPNLQVLGFGDEKGRQPIAPLRIAPLSEDTLICLFDGVLSSVILREPPGKLHHGLEGAAGSYHVTLRSVVGGPGEVNPGEQYESNPKTCVTPCDPAGSHPWACVPMRADERTLNVAAAAGTLRARLGDFGQPDRLTSAELALELTKGVLEVEYRR